VDAIVGGETQRRTVSHGFWFHSPHAAPVQGYVPAGEKSTLWITVKGPEDFEIDLG
jgi:hypothetical protein